MRDRHARLQRSDTVLRKPAGYFFLSHAAVMISRKPRRAAGAPPTLAER